MVKEALIAPKNNIRPKNFPRRFQNTPWWNFTAGGILEEREEELVPNFPSNLLLPKLGKENQFPWGLELKLEKKGKN